MAKIRKIALVAKKFSFKEAGEADDKYWSEKSAECRLLTLMDLRELIYGRMIIKDVKINFISYAE